MAQLTRFAGWMFAVLLTLLLAVPAAAAPAAQSNTATMERTFAAQLRKLQTQDQRLKRADSFAATIERVVQQQKQQGRDVSRIEQALIGYRKGNADARAAWNAASDLLKKRPGFDARGKVTDATQAAKTLRESNTAMKKVSQLAWNAARDLRSALGRYRSATPGFVPPAFPQLP